MNKEKEQEYLHELLDRSHIVLKHLEVSVGEHDFLLKKYPELQEKYDEAESALAELYQSIGRRMD